MVHVGIGRDAAPAAARLHGTATSASTCTPTCCYCLPGTATAASTCTPTCCYCLHGTATAASQHPYILAATASSHVGAGCPLPLLLPLLLLLLLLPPYCYCYCCPPIRSAGRVQRSTDLHTVSGSGGWSMKPGFVWEV